MLHQQKVFQKAYSKVSKKHNFKDLSFKNIFLSLLKAVANTCQKHLKTAYIIDFNKCIFYYQMFALIERAG